MNLIDNAARAAALGEYRIPFERAGMCLAMNRYVTEFGLGWPDHELYRRVVTYESALTAGDPEHYAADAEESFIQRGWYGTTVQPGDWLFSHIPLREKHTGITFRGLDGRLYVLENTAYNRGTLLYGAIRVTPLEQWDRISLIGRWPAELVERPDRVPVPPVSNKTLVRVFNAASGKFVFHTSLIGPGAVEGLKVYIPAENLAPYLR